MSMPSKLITTLTLTTVLLLAGCGDKSPESRIQAAKQAMQAADYKGATIDLKDALQSAPGNVEARLMLGQVLQAQERWADSEKELRKAMELGAGPEQILPWLAHTLVELGKYQEAINLAPPKSGMGSQALASLQAERANAHIALNGLNEAAQAIREGEQALSNSGLSDFSKDLQIAKARLAFMNKQPAEAMALLDVALKKDAKSIQALYMKSRLLMSDHKDAQALETYQQIVSVDPKQLRAHLAIVEIYQKEGNIDAAEKAVQAAEKIAPGNPIVRYARAVVELRRGKFKEANEAVLHVLSVIPDHLPSILVEANTSYALGKYQQSRKDAELVLAQIPDNLSAARVLVASLLKLNDATTAIATLSTLLKIHGDDPSLLALAGEAEMQMRHFSKAMEYLDRAGSLDPKNPAIREQLAASYLAQGETSRAIAELGAASSLSNGSGQADLALIVLQLGQRQYDQALASIATYEKKLRSNPVTLTLRAAAYTGKQDTASARKALEQSLLIDPNFFPAAASLARMDIQSNNPQAARKRFEAILDKDKNNVQAMVAMADMAAITRQEKEYITWLEKAIQLEPKAIPARKRLIDYYLGRKEYDKALAQAKEAAKQSPENPQALNLLGATQLVMNNKKAAVSTYQNIVEKVPNSAGAYLRLARAQLEAKDTTAARANLQKALELKPDYTKAWDALIGMELADGKPGVAIAAARKIQALFPKSPLGFDREAAIHLNQKQYALAAKAYQQSIDRDAGAIGFVMLHRSLLLAGSMQAAEHQLTAWIKEHPKDMVVRDYAASHYMSKGRDQDAISQYETIIKANPNHVVGLNNLASLYQRQRDSRALATSERAYKLAPNQPAIMDTLGWILLEQGQLARAVELLRGAVARAPESGALRYHYAVALSRSGGKAAAKKELEAAINSGGEFAELKEARVLLKGL